MASLRTRLLVSVLLLAAAGLIALAAVTYAQQRSFLEGRVDPQAKGARPALSGLPAAVCPLGAGDRPLPRRRVAGGLVTAGGRGALALGAFFVGRRALRPPNRRGAPGGQIAAGELSRGVTPATTRTEVGRLGLA